MADTPHPLETMRQTTLSLVDILTAHEGRRAEDVMSDLMRFAQQLDGALLAVQNAMRTGTPAEDIQKAIAETTPLALSCGARDLLAMTDQCIAAFQSSVDAGAPLDSTAMADLVVWTTVARQTSISVKVLFHTARLYGRAPNGARLPTD